MRVFLGSSIALVALASIVGFKQMGGAQSFSLQDPKGVSGLSISIDSKLEPVKGFANGVSGNVTFDPSKPSAATGTVVIDAASTYVASRGMTEAMHQDWCLDVAKYPTIEFKITKVTGVKAGKDGTYSAKVSGDFTLKGITKAMTVDATATHLPNMIKQRGGMPGKDGDLLVIRSNFSFKRSDFKIAPDLSTNVIGDRVDIGLSFVAVSPR
jgi:polyisoprenoid-binding protein YceI